MTKAAGSRQGQTCHRSRNGGPAGEIRHTVAARAASDAPGRRRFDEQTGRWRTGTQRDHGQDSSWCRHAQDGRAHVGRIGTNDGCTGRGCTTRATRVTRLANATISIIDDDESMRMALADLVRLLGFQAVIYACAEDFASVGYPQRVLLYHHRYSYAGPFWDRTDGKARSRVGPCHHDYRSLGAAFTSQSPRKRRRLPAEKAIRRRFFAQLPEEGPRRLNRA